MKKKNVLNMYTDGSFHPNTKKGGYAALVPELNQIICGVDCETTNNKMELTAVIRGLNNLPEKSTVVVHSDSRYVTDAFNKKWISNWQKNNWKTSTGMDVKNKEEWELLLEEKSKHKKVEFVWVKAHNGDTYNEAVDELANAAALTKI